MQCACAHSRTVPGGSERLGISGYSDKRVQCAGARLCTVPRWSEYQAFVVETEVDVMVSSKLLYGWCLHSLLNFVHSCGQ